MHVHVDELLKRAAEQNASDLHLTVGSTPICRIDSKLIPYEDSPLTAEEMKKFTEEILNEADRQTLYKVGEIDTSYQIGNSLRFRINAYFQKNFITIAARVIPTRIPTLEELSMPLILKKLAMRKQGLILVTGPTGSGKSTTLAAILDLNNTSMSKHIITLEDPIEYIHDHKQSVVHQREIGHDTRSFANALRASLRQDPDVILVGEMRDLETISTAITAAETGHLVLATLHTNGAAQTINRIIDVFPANQQPQIRIQLADFLQGIISQQLLPRKDGKGRIATTEILVNQPGVANLIRNAKIDQIANIMQTSRSSGMHLMEMSIQELMTKNMIDQDVADMYMNDAGGFNASL